ncbi:MAG: glycosyltransferase [Rhodobacterales bacterium]|nr:glycosyltransferase [Rhodobacterales bacterium]
MRVLHVDTAREWRGGQQQLLLLASMQPECAVALPPDAALYDRLVCAGVRVFPVHFQGSLRGTRSLKSVIQAFCPDVVAAHTSHGHGHCVASGHRPVVVHRRLDFSPSRWSRRKYAAADGFVAVSGGVATVLVDYGVPKSKIRVVWDCVEPALDQGTASILRRSMGLQTTDKLALCAGAVVGHKGHRYAIQALTYARQWHLAIAGKGPLSVELQAFARKQKVADRVHWLGHRDDLVDWFSAADRLVHPSTEEGMGQVVVEAMMAGCPVLVSDVGGLPEIVGNFGQIVPSGDGFALAQALQQPPVPPASFEVLARRFSPQALLKRTEAAYRFWLAVC